jgi:exodeoxyribonuclease VII small subunit
MAPSTQPYKDEDMTAPEDRTFEDLYAELEETVRKLEAGDLPLAESLALFERSTALAELCNALLDDAELRVRQLAQGPAGDLADQPFEGWQG